ncbi:MAG TPA: NADH:flavin oxidoreductase, partial [Caldilineaceae bacterium]|nr:NADH:flavin oxidoreductase [Caldilineaceae bacterium]
MVDYRRGGPPPTAEGFFWYAGGQGAHLPFDHQVESGPTAPLAQPLPLAEQVIGNRFAVLPMEGWDGTSDGRPTAEVRRRWQRFGESGAKLIWGCEAVAVRADGRANPNQLMILPETLGDLAAARELLVKTHEAHFGRSDDLLIGLQLTHSGRFCRPHDKRLEPQILYHHPILDKKFGLPPGGPLMSDAEIDRLVDQFVEAACMAHAAGFAFVDIKHCHGYLGHEFLSALDRP